MRAAVFVLPVVLLCAGCGRTQPKDRSRSASNQPLAFPAATQMCEAGPGQSVIGRPFAPSPLLSCMVRTPPLHAALPLAKHVIIVSEDGMRPDLLTAAEAPLHHRLMAEGAYSLHAMTIRRASTLPSHAAMLSGFDVEAHGLYWNSWRPERGFIKVPTVFSAAAETGKGVAAFVGKQKLAHIIRPERMNMFATPSYLCRKVAEEAIRYFLEHKPQVEFVHFSDPDSFGHKDGWMSDSQRKAVTSSDRCLRTLIDGIARSELANDTLVIVSADHGGHGHNHSGSCLEDRLIPWFAWGVGVKPGHKIGDAISTVDTAATTLWALGLEAPPGQQGRPVKDAFR